MTRYKPRLLYTNGNVAHFAIAISNIHTLVILFDEMCQKNLLMVTLHNNIIHVIRPRISSVVTMFMMMMSGLSGLCYCELGYFISADRM